MDLLPDTNTLSYILRGRQPVLNRFEEAVRQGSSFLLASVAHYELQRYLELKGAGRLQKLYESLVARWQRCNLDLDDWDEAARLWAERHRTGRSISDLDLLLAILARKHQAVLVTSNTKHFEGLDIPLADWSLP
ncbi:MAG: PIN domain-containing protein [Thermoanaerobaculia bacterium]